MPIAGLQKTSLIDYPGLVSCVIFLTGCNFACPYCHNPELARGHLPAGGAMALDALAAFLEERRGFLDAVVITGGEPTLSAELTDIGRAIKSLGYRLKLDTNGSRPKVLAHLLEAGLVDYLAMDLKTLPEEYAPHLSPRPCAQALTESIGIIRNSGLPHEFRTTCVRPFVDIDRIAAMARCIAGAPLYALQALQTESLLNPDFFQTPPAPFTSSEMAQLQAAAAPYVQRCILR
ncbi:MAG: anaerobic ribonucleoside-triphosphate reductase activating protein [Desulfobacteraceae bacterium]|jgi:pyruvate formate lyase activating enzyme|nr:anaerobic ribonucleoside-triphosphate reductase activating protein [Desulfobacteraceae bacterium]